MAVASARAPRIRFMCSDCGADAPKWEGRCAACGAWNSLIESPPATRGRSRPLALAASTMSLASVACESSSRAATGIAEVDRVLGGGLVPGSVVLLGGDPGVGKSTLALELAARGTRTGEAVLYCSGEESGAQLGLRAARTGCSSARIELLIETDTDAVVTAIETLRPALAIVDSVQTLFDPTVAGGPGSPAQVRSAVSRLVSAAKATGVATILIGHVTKEGAIAGPRTLEHMVDIVLYLEGDRLGNQRVLRGIKNRFGSTGEIGLLSMESGGIRELTAPDRAFLDGASLGISGNVLTVTCDGVRPLAVEVQGLAVKTSLAIPRRTCSGFDFNRLCLLLAVLEKRCSLPFGHHDVFLNAAGGIHLSDPGVDLAVALAVAGSVADRRLPSGWAALGEVGLGGEVRPVSRLDARVAEAAAAGVTDVVAPPKSRIETAAGIRVHTAATVKEALLLLA